MDKLSSYNQFIVWKLIWNKDREKFDKIPYQPKNINEKASSTNKNHWTDINLAIKVYTDNNEIDGIGFVLSKDDPFVFIDLDKCKDEQWALDYIKILNSWTEISQSGNGYHIIVEGAKPDKGCRKGQIEIYDSGRFVALTGNLLDGYEEINKNQDGLNEIYFDTFPPIEEQTSNNNLEIANPDITIDDVLRVSKQDMKFQELYSGDTSKYTSHSEADYGFCHKLVFYCGNNPQLISDIFTQSGLYRKKWNRKNYRDKIIDDAIRNQTEYFNWNGGNKETNTMDEQAGSETKTNNEVFNNIFDLSDVCKMNLPEPKWVVKDLVPEGVTLLGGKAKVGKSYFVLNMVLDIIQGGLVFGNFQSKKTEVLFLALEDSLRRMKKRGLDLLPDMPKGCHISTEWEVGEKSVNLIREYLKLNPQIELVVIDTLAMVREVKSGNQTLYTIDYNSLKDYRKLSQENGISIIVVTHNRKAESDDPLDLLSGSTGLTGASDNVLVLKPYSKRNVDASLYVRGNDVEMNEYALSFTNKRWIYEGEASEYIGTDKENEVLSLFDMDEEITIKEVSIRHNEIDYNYAKGIIKRLADKEIIKKVRRGVYKRV